MATIPSIAVIPSGYKASKLYSVLPTDGSGDLDVVRATTATRVNQEGLIENVLSNVPRLDYTDGGCPSLLVEPQRTNLLLRSEEFDDAYWIKSASTILANTTNAPNGLLTADKLVEDTSASAHRFLSTSFSTTSGVVYSFSIFLKKDSRNFAYVRFNNSGGDIIAANINLTNGTVSQLLLGNVTIIPFDNDWFRVIGIGTSTSTSSGSVEIRTSNSENYSNYTGDGTSGIYIWGAQLEAGLNATSYIPTVASTVTRNQDVISKTGISSLINSEEGVLYAEIGALANDLTTKQLSLSDGTLNNRIVLGFPSSGGVVYFEIRNGGTAIAFVSVPVASVVDISKIAVKFKNDDFALWINGIEVAIDNSGILPTGLNRLAFDNGNATGGQFYGNCKDLRVYTTALSDSELQALTQI